MSISNLLVQQVYTTNGVTLNFPIPFAFLPGDAETVTKVYKVNTTTGVKTLQVIGALNDYTLPHDIDTEPANVVFNSAPNNCDVLVTRLLAVEQAIEFLNSGQMLLDNIEDGMDILTMLIQQVNEIAQKSVRLHEIQGIADFDTTLPMALDQNPGATIIVNLTGDGFIIGPTVDDISLAAGYAAAAAASADAAAASAIEASAAGFDSTGSPHAITDGQAATVLSSNSFDGTIYKSVIFMFTVKRGTTVMSSGLISMHYLNGTWVVVEGPYSGQYHGITWSVTQVTTVGSLNAALDSGAGNGTVDFKKIKFVA